MRRLTQVRRLPPEGLSDTCFASCFTFVPGSQIVDLGVWNPWMFLPESFLTAACQPVASEILSRDEDVLQRLVAHTKKRFSGCLAVTVSGNQIQTWNLYFLNGSLVGSTGGVHPVRCWRRQIIRCCPQLNYRFFQSTLDSSQLWHYSELMQRVEQGQLYQARLLQLSEGL